MRLGRVTKVYRDASQERHATEYNGAYAVEAVFVDQKLADTEQVCMAFLTMQSEDDYSYPDEGSIVGIGVYENTSLFYVDHITPFGKLVPGLQPGQHQIGDSQTHVLVDTEQSKVDIEADNIDVDADLFTNKAGIQNYIADQLSLTASYILNLISKGDVNLNALGFLSLEAGRFSITSVENATITATQALDFVVGLACQIVTGTNFSIVSQLGSAEMGNLLGTVGVDVTGLLIAENQVTDLNTIIAGIIDEINKIVVAYGTGPNVAALTALKAQMALLYK